VADAERAPERCGPDCPHCAILAEGNAEYVAEREAAERAPAAGAQEPVAWLPCPFCGEAERIIPRSDGASSCYYACFPCGAVGPYMRDEEEALDAWNDRAAPAPQVAEPSGVEREDEAWLEAQLRDAENTCFPGADRFGAARYRRILASLRELAEWRERSRAAGRIAGELNRERLARLRAGRDATPASEQG
jgi:Lar family restriction alleviation protein